MNKTLGLDLGVTSIGWALISKDDNGHKEILGLGSRIIPLSSTDNDEFSKGNAISKNRNRTEKRSQRKGYDRYQLRKKNLKQLLEQHDMFPIESLIKLSSIQLYELREKAIKEKIELRELGRVLYHLNQRRGYKSSRSDSTLEKKDTDYVAEVKSRHQLIKNAGQTIGQHFYEKLKETPNYRIKQQVFPREAYVEEFEAICREQKKYHPVLTDIIVAKLRNEIIYYQRKLKSQKALVSICELEGKIRKNEKGIGILTGPKVAPKSSPLFQICKIWETINSISIKNRKGEILIIDNEKKKQIFDYLDNNERLSQAELLGILELNKNDGWYTNKQISKGLQGNLTKVAILKHLQHTEHLLQFDLNIEATEVIDFKSGEVKQAEQISANFEQQPFYQLWHTIYSISDAEECRNALKSKFNLSSEIADHLIKLDFTKSAFGNKSAKAMRKILPHLMHGLVYSSACSIAGYNHSNSLTKEERQGRSVDSHIELLKKNSLRQPIVEKILNQLINVVNEIIKEYGSFNNDDEIRIELARELKQSKDERNETMLNISANETINNEVIKRLIELGLPSKRRNIEKYKFIFPVRNKKLKEAIIKNQCIYCGEQFSLSEALSGNNFDVDHIIPQSLLFDDSQTNKVLVHRKCNAEDKKNKTAYDFIRAKGDIELQKYLTRLDEWYKQGILSYSKMERLKASHEDYLDRKNKKKETEADKKLWENFIARQLRETQYITRKSKNILEQVCNNVWSTSGNITQYLRTVWGWNEVTMNLQLQKYADLGLTERKHWQTNNGQFHSQEIIKDWSKRDDHRHHAIDALIIACTEQSFVQRINTLNASTTRDEMKKEVDDAGIDYDRKKNLLENFIFSKKPFTTKQVEDKVDNILISFKPGKRIGTISKHKATGKNKETGVLVPRGPLSEESVYGKIKTIVKKQPLKFLFENPQNIFKPYIKALVEERLSRFNGDTKKAIASVKEEPIFLDKDQAIILQFGTCYIDEYVIKYPLNTDFTKADKIIDEKIKKIISDRLDQYNNNPKEAFKNIENDPIWFNHAKNIPIKTVRCSTGLSAVEPIKKNEQGENIGFVKPANNHHIAIYLDADGKKKEHICSFWHAVERKKNNIPAVIKDSKNIWDSILTSKLNYTESFLEKLPRDNWIFQQSIQQNEMFILGLSKEEIEIAISEKNKKFISKFLYLAWSISESDYWFRHHLETKNSDLKKINEAKESKRYYRFKSVGAFEKMNPIKVKINILGEISF
ncbi:type II CRISPR RNA-guided endonuclease Cas9 [Mucilaginibacter sp. X4EP1]|uniref:type II CRISPR RNA-guided endonuclease Cas9 n=1 Tax=Mucilaginibacter sp. X4EP1 TaxID=2723092 RepID=UPI0021698DC9|nr:type II CRISPR RNA-guided endonuclease Cas9 [Mucilaginibacter sp. X4EP1]MCS3813304.1 CRISPR-associated endonuclease Csn1 [Mucilaginibacter sp. X4EP1]